MPEKRDTGWAKHTCDAQGQSYNFFLLRHPSRMCLRGSYRETEESGKAHRLPQGIPHDSLIFCFTPGQLIESYLADDTSSPRLIHMQFLTRSWLIIITLKSFAFKPLLLWKRQEAASGHLNEEKGWWHAQVARQLLRHETPFDLMRKAIHSE
jgi:hypothetical protein